MTGIYAIVCKATSRCYIGQSVDIETRTRKHREQLKRGKHHNYLLQRAWEKYDEDQFVFVLLEECSIKSITKREVFWIDYFDSMNPKRGFNIIEPNSCVRGEASPHSMLTDKQVEQMLEMMQECIPNREIAKLFPVGEEVVSNIRCGYAWSHIRPDIDRKAFPVLMKLQDNDIIEIRILLRDTYMEMSEIAKIYGVAASTIKKIKSGKYRGGIGNEIIMPKRNISYRNVKMDTREKVNNDIKRGIPAKEIATNHQLSMKCVKKFIRDYKNQEVNYGSKIHC